MSGIGPLHNNVEDILGTLRNSLPPKAGGIEIGAHSLPVAGIAPYYVDRVRTYAGSVSRVDILADGLVLPFPTSSLDYVCASHVLEHLANPINALLEWHRVLKGGGLLYLVVPDKRFTFDQPRRITSPAHVVNDFVCGTTKTDIEHVHDFIYHTDWDRLRPGTNPSQKESDQEMLFAAYAGDVKSGNTVDIHYHTFTPESLIESLTNAHLIGPGSMCFHIAGSAERYPPERGDGIALLLRKNISRSKPSKFDTYRYKRTGDFSDGIPLVCPLTLEPLEMSHKNDVQVLRSVHSNNQYSFSDSVPVMLPSKAQPRGRWWLNRFKRRLWLSPARWFTGLFDQAAKSRLADDSN